MYDPKLIDERNAAYNEAKALVEKAQTEKRPLVKEEQERFDSLIGKIDQITARLGDAHSEAAQNCLRSIQTFLSESHGRATDGASFGLSNECRTLRADEARVLRPDEKLANLYRPAQPGKRTLNIGNLVRIMAGIPTEGDVELERRQLGTYGDSSGGVLLDSTVSADV